MDKIMKNKYLIKYFVITIMKGVLFLLWYKTINFLQYPCPKQKLCIVNHKSNQIIPKHKNVILEWFPHFFLHFIAINKLTNHLKFTRIRWIVEQWRWKVVVNYIQFKMKDFERAEKKMMMMMILILAVISIQQFTDILV